MNAIAGMRLGFAVSLVCGIAAAQAVPLPAGAGAHAPLTLDVVVTAKNGGKPVAGLTQQDFTLLENKAPQPIGSFRAVGPDSQVEVILVLDAVNASSVTIGYERQQLDSFLRGKGEKLARPVALAVLTETGVQMQDSLTDNGDKLAAELDGHVVGLRSVGRSAGFYGAEERVSDSLNGLSGLVEHVAKMPGRKLMVFLSPGWPLLTGPRIQLSSKEQDGIFTSIQRISSMLRESRVTLYSIDPRGANAPIMSRFYYQDYVKGVSKPGQVDQADLSLQVLATQSGGLVLNSSNDIPAQVQQCLDDASAYYELTFRPAPAEKPNEYHALQVKVATPGLVARTTQGYYAQP
jgi:VWFA-related protein